MNVSQLSVLERRIVYPGGRVIRGATVRVVYAGTNVDAPLFSDSRGGFAQRLPSSTLTANASGWVRAWAHGVFDLIISAPGQLTTIETAVAVNGAGITPFDLNLDPAANDVAAGLNTLALRIADLSTSRDLRGVPISLDLCGRSWNIASDTVRVPNTEMVVVEGGTLRAQGGDWVFPAEMLRLGGARTKVRDVHFACNKRASGLNLVGGGQRVRDCFFFDFHGAGQRPGDGYGINAEGSSGDTWIDDNQFTGINNGDPDYLSDANIRGIGVRIARADIKLRGNTIRWCGVNVYVTADARSIWIMDNHLYGGRSGIASGTSYVPAQRSKNIVMENGGGIICRDNYLDNGEIDLFGSNASFNGNSALYNPEAVYVEYFIGLYCNGNPTPQGFESGNWKFSSDRLLNGEKTFIKFLPHPTTGQAWQGDYTLLERLGGRTTIGADMRWATTDTNGDAVAGFYSPAGATALELGAPGATSRTGVPRMQSFDGRSMQIRSLARRMQTLSAGARLTDDKSGMRLNCNFAIRQTIVLGADLPTGFEAELCVLATGGLRLQHDAGTFFVGRMPDGSQITQSPESDTVPGSVVRVCDAGFDTQVPPRRLYVIEGNLVPAGVVNNPLLPAFTASVTEGYAPLEVTFDSSASSGPITSRVWDANGDATSDGTGTTLTYTYTTPGVYTVSLRLNGTGGPVDLTREAYITVLARGDN